VNAPSLDVEGYLVDPSEWSEDWARATADAMNVTLTDEHWEAIGFMRKFYDEHQVAPDARFVMRHLSETRGAPRNRLFELFPFGYPGQACKIAGMRKPRAWSTGRAMGVGSTSQESVRTGSPSPAGAWRRN